MKIGLVLSGGGGKGAYELGCWKAFEEEKIIFDAISGSSIGALNGLLMGVSNYPTAMHIWQGVSALTNQHSSEFSGILPEDIAKMDQCFATPAALVEAKNSQGKLPSMPLFKLLDQLYTEELYKKLDKDLYICAVGESVTPHPTYFHLNEMSLEKGKKALVSSTALPYIFDGIEIDNQRYYDGGIMDVTPITPLVDAGCDVIFSVYLKNSRPLNLEHLKQATVIPIVPSKPLGSFADGTMDFSLKGIQWRHDLGYADTQRLLKRLKAL